METILDIDPDDRKIIKIGDYSQIKLIVSKKQTNIEKLKRVSKAAGIGLGGRLAGRAALALISPIGAALLVGATDLMSIKKLLQTKDSSDFAYIEVPIKQAYQFLNWKGANSPEKNTFYIKSPHKDNVYISASKFHTVLFEEKYTEAIDLLMALKPKNLIVEHREGYSQEIRTKAGVLKDGLNALGNFMKDGKNERKIMFKGEFKKPISLERDKLSSNLIWYPAEEKWQSIVEGVTKHGLEHVEMDILYDDDFGVNTELELSLAKVAGGSAAVKFVSYKRTLWKVKATFW